MLQRNIERMLRDRGCAEVRCCGGTDDDATWRAYGSCPDTVVLFIGGGSALTARSVAERAAEARGELSTEARVVLLHRRALDYVPQEPVRRVVFEAGGVQLMAAARFEHFHLPDHELVPRHELVPPPSVDAELRTRLRGGARELCYLPLLCAGDAMYEHLGARPGNVVRITRRTPDTGAETLYRLAVLNDTEQAVEAAVRWATAAAAAAAAAL